jgi:hypothetical protein
MPTDDSSVGSPARGLFALRLILERAGISRADPAREHGCTRQWVHDILNGRARPSPKCVRGVSIILAGRLTADHCEIRAISFGDHVDEPRPSKLRRRPAEAGAS